MQAVALSTYLIGRLPLERLANGLTSCQTITRRGETVNNKDFKLPSPTEIAVLELLSGKKMYGLEICQIL